MTGPGRSLHGRQSVQSVGLLGLVTLAFVIASVAWELRLNRSPGLLLLQLATERNVATWWSASLNMLAGLLAFENASTDGLRHRRTWQVLGALCLILSFTELGSLHEQSDDPVQFAFGVIIAAMAAMSLVGLRARQGSRPAFLLAATAFGLLAFTTLQEHARSFTSLLDDVQLLSTALEESLEVTAALLILLAVTWCRRRHVDGPGWATALADPSRIVHLGGLVTGGALVHAGITLFFSPWLAVAHHGDPASWFPAAAFLIVALSLVWGPHGGDPSRPARWQAAWAMGLAALVVVALPPASADRFADLGELAEPRHLVVGALLASLAVVPHWGRRGKPARLSVAVIVGLACVDTILDLFIIRYLVAGMVPVVLLHGLRAFEPASARKDRRGPGSTGSTRERRSGPRLRPEPGFELPAGQK